MTRLAFLVPVLAALAAPATSQDPPGYSKLAAVSTAGFGLDLYRELADDDETTNLVLSPWSIALAMAAAAEGARDETREQLKRALHLRFHEREAGDLEPAHRSFAALKRRLELGGGATDDATRAKMRDLRLRLAAANDETDAAQRQRKWDEAQTAAQHADEIARELNQLLFRVDRYELRTANSLWVDRSFPLAPAFEAALRPHYGIGGARVVDFAKDTEGSRKAINAWVAENTASRIPEFLGAGALDPATRMAIVDAVWFRGAWQEPFEPTQTREEDFTLRSGDRVKAKTMRDPFREDVRYGAFLADGKPFATPRKVPGTPGAAQPECYPGDDGFLAVEIPYRGREIAMLVLLPRRHDGLARLESLLTAERLGRWCTEMQAFDVDLALPRFEFRTRSQLAKALQALGAKRAFEAPGPDGRGAQFDGLTTSRSAENALCIDAVLHEAWIETNEEGTEAAAATGVLAAPGAAAMPDTVPFRPVFHADRPFVFAIRDTVTGALLFVGRVADPRG